MRSIQLPEPLYAEAERAAAASGLSVEAYIQEALQLHIEEDGPVRLTSDQVAIIAQSEADIDGGRGISLEEVRLNLPPTESSGKQRTRSEDHFFSGSPRRAKRDLRIQR